jgi:hypothetical protein
MSNTKKYLLLLGIMGWGILAEAQFLPKNLPNYDQKQWHFGFTLGVNTMNFNIHPVDQINYDNTVLIIQPTLSQGFNIGIVANKKLVKYLDLRFVPTLSFGQRNLNYIIKTSPVEEKSYTKTVESTFLDFPLTVKYKSKRFDKNLNNVRVYVLGGVRYSIDLASQKKKKGTSDDIVLKLNPHDFMFTGGVGFDFYLPYFKLGIELQMAYGILNVINKEETIFTTNVDRLNSKMSWITLTFE